MAALASRPARADSNAARHPHVRLELGSCLAGYEKEARSAVAVELGALLDDDPTPSNDVTVVAVGCLQPPMIELTVTTQ